MSGIAKYSVNCPRCGKGLKVPVALAGKKGTCSGCQSSFVIPAPREEPAQDLFSAPPTADDFGLAPLNSPGSIGGSPIGGSSIAGGSIGAWDNLALGAAGSAPPVSSPYDDLLAAPMPGPGAAGANPFAKPADGGNPLVKAWGQPDPTNANIYPTPRPKAPERPTQGVSYEGDGGFFAPEAAGISMGVVGGILMIGIAAAWFFIGLWAGYIFYYPPILFLIGCYALIKGLIDGNLAG